MAGTKPNRQQESATSAQIESDDFSSSKKLVNFPSGAVGQKSPTGAEIADEFSSGEAELTDTQISDKDKSIIKKNKAAEWFFKIMTWFIPGVLLVVAIVGFGYLLNFSGKISKVEENVRNIENNQAKIESDNDLKFDRVLQDILSRISRLEDKILK